MWLSKQVTWKKGIQVLSVLALVLFILSGCGSVVKYDGGEISLKQLDGYLGADKFFNYSQQYAQSEAQPTFKEQMTKQYVAFLTLTSKIDEKTKQASAKTAKDQLAQIKKSIEGQAAPNNNINDILKQLKISENDIEKYIALRINFMDVMTKKFPDDKVKAEYDKKIKADKNAYIDTATVSHILIALKDSAGKDLRTKEAALARAKEVKDKLDKGGDFAALAKEYSDDPGSKDAGGTYKDAPINQWVTGFKEATMTLPINKISDPVETQFGYHIMKVESRNSNKYADVIDKVRGTLVQAFFSDYMLKQIPQIIKSINLPKPSATPTTAPAPALTPAPSVAPVQTTTPAPTSAQ